MRRWKERNRSVLFISHRLAEVREHCDMCTVLRDGRDVASFVPRRGRRGADRRRHARRGRGRWSGDEARGAARRPGIGPSEPALEVVRDLRRRPPARRRLASRSGPARCSAWPRSRARARTGCSRSCRQPPGRPRRDPGRRPAAQGPAPLRRHPPRRRAGAGRPAARPAAAAARSGRTSPSPLFNRVAPLGADQRRPASGASVAEAVDRLSIDTRAAAPGPAAVRRQPAEGDDRPLAGRRVPGDAAVRPDPGHRRRHQAPGLRPGPGSWPTRARPIVMFTSELREIGLVCDRAAVLHNGAHRRRAARRRRRDRRCCTAAHGLAARRDGG